MPSSLWNESKSARWRRRWKWYKPTSNQNPYLQVHSRTNIPSMANLFMILRSTLSSSGIQPEICWCFHCGERNKSYALSKQSIQSSERSEKGNGRTYLRGIPSRWTGIPNEAHPCGVFVNACIISRTLFISNCVLWYLAHRSSGIAPTFRPIRSWQAISKSCDRELETTTDIGYFGKRNTNELNWTQMKKRGFNHSDVRCVGDNDYSRLCNTSDVSYFLNVEEGSGLGMRMKEDGFNTRTCVTSGVMTTCGNANIGHFLDITTSDGVINVLAEWGDVESEVLHNGWTENGANRIAD